MNLQFSKVYLSVISPECLSCSEKYPQVRLHGLIQLDSMLSVMGSSDAQSQLEGKQEKKKKKKEVTFRVVLLNEQQKRLENCGTEVRCEVY